MQTATTDEVRARVRWLIDNLCGDGGAILCTAMNAEWDIPMENIVAVYEEILQKKIL